ncbi:N-acetylglucosaminyl-phosphatidylinositol de-N-acetylase-like [Ptychodera flava]|uniref:N-acetylglucosaminyl-phosphatidylinositol de-N-acetylase-like n=1 Tax=Ptychodera flava TaxID=63121 RepID=UPI003969F560
MAVFITCLVAIVVLIAYQAFVLIVKNYSRHHFKRENVLFVTAHPDDECMFFSPTILTVDKAFLTCLSSGNYYNLGEERRKELLASCRILGISDQNVAIIDNSHLKDDPNATWDEDIISAIILAKIQKHRINVVVTFDDYGVSGHKNHTSVYKALRQLVTKKQLPTGVQAYCLESIPLWRKYLLQLDLPISCLLPQGLLFVSSWQGVWQAQKAMYAHWSQFVWFRVLYIIFSRYMVINTLKPIRA